MPVVVVEARERRYRRYVGKVCTNEIVAIDGTLSPQLVEMFRVDPKSILPDEPITA